MNKMLKAFALSGAIALGLIAGTYGSAEAGAITRDSAVASHADTKAPLVEVQYRHHRHHRHWRHHHRRHYRSGGSFFFGFGTPYYYRPYYRPYYVRPPVYVRPTYVAPAYGRSSAHVRWCYNRYRSYRASDNTYQPYNGPRRQCYSPYS